MLWQNRNRVESRVGGLEASGYLANLDPNGHRRRQTCRHACARREPDFLAARRQHAPVPPAPPIAAPFAAPSPPPRMAPIAAPAPAPTAIFVASSPLVASASCESGAVAMSYRLAVVAQRVEAVGDACASLDASRPFGLASRRRPARCPRAARLRRRQPRPRAVRLEQAPRRDWYRRQRPTEAEAAARCPAGNVTSRYRGVEGVARAGSVAAAAPPSVAAVSDSVWPPPHPTTPILAIASMLTHILTSPPSSRSRFRARQRARNSCDAD